VLVHITSSQLCKPGTLFTKHPLISGPVKLTEMLMDVVVNGRFVNKVPDHYETHRIK